MSLWVDVSYLKQVGSRLDGFKEIKLGSLWNCRCPLCGDSAKKKKKKRGYFYQQGNELFYKCHNCQASMRFGKFLRGFDPNLYNRYRLEKFKATSTSEPTPVMVEPKTPPATRQFVPNIVADIPSLDDLPKGHPARAYVEQRKIPELMWGSLFYAPKFYAWARGNTDKFNKMTDVPDHPRLVIPWYSADGVIFAYHARAFGPEEPKYYSIVLKKDYEQFYGLERFDPTKRGYILEGPLDSLFLPNALAVGTAALLRYDYADRDTVYIPDRDTRNKEVMALVEKMVKAGKQVCLLPHDFPGKDVNAAIQAGMTPKEVLAVVETHTYSGLSLALNFNVWRKL